MKAQPRPYRAMKIGTEEWVEGSYFCNASDESIIIEVIDMPPTWADPCGDRQSIYHHVDSKTLSQSTGQTDRAGQLLWEDDVVSDQSGERFVVVWWRSALRLKNMKTGYMWPFDAGKVVKAGTIYDAPGVLYGLGCPMGDFSGHDDEE